jgi:outer membrane usher protein
MFILEWIDRDKPATPYAILSCVLILCASAARCEPLQRDPALAVSSVAPRVTAENTTERKSASGIFQTRFASRHGVAAISLMASGDVGDARVARLDTTFAAALPDGQRGLRLGDSVTQPGTWGRTLRFGGIHFGAGLANGAGDGKLPSWPSAARRFAPGSVLPSAALGVPEDSPQFAQMTRPAPDFLPPGTVYPTYAVGFLRTRYGLDGDRYGPFFASAKLRRGLSPDATTELRGGAQAGVANCGIALRLRVPHLGVLSAATAASESDAGTGSLAQTGFQYSLAGFSTSVRSQWTSREFRYLGPREDTTVPPRYWSVFRANYATKRYGIIGMAYAALANVDESIKKAVRATYQIAFGRVSTFSLSASRTIAPEPATAVTLALTISLEDVARRSDASSAGAFQMPLREPIPTTTALR